MAIDEDVEALEARVRDLHVQAQALNKQAGREGEATALYKQLAELDDEALELRLARARPAASATALARHAEQFAGYCRLHPPAPTWQQAASAGNCPERAQLLRQRALGAVLGSALADAAACGVQWVYSQAQLDSLAAGEPSGCAPWPAIHRTLWRRHLLSPALAQAPALAAQCARSCRTAAARRAAGAGVFRPAAVPVLRLPSGKLQPLWRADARAAVQVARRGGGAAVARLCLSVRSLRAQQAPRLPSRSLVEQRGLHCCRYAAALYSAFGPGYRGYRDRSTKSFLRRHAAGLLPPLTGSPGAAPGPCFVPGPALL